MYSSEIQIRVRYGETDKMGYLYYGNYALYYEVGRTDLIRTLGISYKELEQSGIIMPVMEHHSRFLRPALYDDLITVKTTLRDLPKYTRMTFHTELFNEEHKLLNAGYTTLAFVNISSGKTCNAPEILLEKLSPFFE